MNNGPPPSRDRRSLQDLAKLASSPTLGTPSAKTPAPPSVAPPPPSSSGHDSGIVDLKQIANADPGGEARAKTTPLASAPLFDEETPSIPPPPSAPSSPSSRPAAKSAPASSPRVAAGAPASKRPVAAAPAATAAAKGPMLAVVAGLGIAAVAALIVVATRPPKVAPVASEPTAAPSSAAATPANAAPASPSSAAAVASNAPAATPAPAASGGELDTSPAGNADPGKGGGGGGVTLRRASTGGRKPGGEAVNLPAGQGGTSVSPLTAMMAEATKSAPVAPIASAPPGALGEAVEHAVGANGAATPASGPAAPSGPQFAPGSVPDKPSQGAVTSALGKVLPVARNCLNPDDAVSRANVTFSSTGSVSAVVVSGSAAGKLAGDCIKAALMKASVPPFAQETYSANVTVRPN